MADVVVTGAHSYLGDAVVRGLRRSGHTVAGIVTPWAQRPTPVPNVKYFAADLQNRLPPEIGDRLRSADHVLHLAWRREPTADASCTTNQRMVATLLAHAAPARVAFMSSVAAARNTPSVYGTAKWRVQEEAVRAGCVAHACGLVLDDPPQSAYRLVHTIVARLPVRIRFVMGGGRVYPIAIDDVVDSLTAYVGTTPRSGTYAMFLPGGLGINQFLAALEERTLRFRVPVPVPFGAVLTLATLLRVTPARGVAEKLLTFLTKDDAALSQLAPMPGLTLARTEAFLAGAAAAFRQERV